MLKDSKTETDILIEACRENDVYLLKKLIKKGIDLNLQDDYRVNALTVATSRGNIKCIKKLLKAGANPNIKSFNGDTPLITASWYGNKSIIKLLLKSGADPNEQGDDSDTALLCATTHGYLNCIILLLKAGADPNIKNSLKINSVLSLAIEYKYNRILKLYNKINIMYFLKVYEENFKLFNRNIIQELSLFL